MKMNNDVMPSIVQMDEATLKNLLQEVKETVATGIAFQPETTKRFTAVNMWKIRRNAKMATSWNKR